jgi:hypothetical protein
MLSNKGMDRQIRKDQAMVTLVFIAQCVGGLIGLAFAALAFKECFGDIVFFFFVR